MQAWPLLDQNQDHLHSKPRCTEPALVYPGLADKRELLHPTGYALTVKLGAGI